MRIKLAENLPTGLARGLTQHGHETDTVMDEALAGLNDARVWEAAQNSGRFFSPHDYKEQ